MWHNKLISNRFGYLPSNPTNSENFRSGFLAVKSHKPLLQPTLCPTISSLKHKHTRYLQLIWMVKRELKSPLLKLHLNVGTIWNIYLPLILDSIITKWKFALVTYRMIWRKKFTSRIGWKHEENNASFI